MAPGRTAPKGSRKRCSKGRISPSSACWGPEQAIGWLCYLQVNMLRLMTCTDSAPVRSELEICLPDFDAGAIATISPDTMQQLTGVLYEYAVYAAMGTKYAFCSDVTDALWYTLIFADIGGSGISKSVQLGPSTWQAIRRSPIYLSRWHRGDGHGLEPDRVLIPRATTQGLRNHIPTPRHSGACINAPSSHIM